MVTEVESELKKCPRCGGNIFLNQEHDLWYFECLQCSYARDLDKVTMQPKTVDTAALRQERVGKKYLARPTDRPVAE